MAGRNEPLGIVCLAANSRSWALTTSADFDNSTSLSITASPSSSFLPRTTARNRSTRDAAQSSTVNQTSTDSETLTNENSCGCTINVNAGLAFWYPVTIFNAIASISTIYPDLAINQTDSSYTLIPHTSTFDGKEAILKAGVSYQLTQSYDSSLKSTVEDYIAVTPTPPPVASTIFTTVSEVERVAPNRTFGEDVLRGLFTGAPDPTYAVPEIPALTA